MAETAAHANTGLMMPEDGWKKGLWNSYPCKLEAEREDKGDDELKERLAIAEQLKISRFVMKIDGDGAVLACRFGGIAHVSSPSHQAS